MKVIIVLADHDGVITRYGPYEGRDSAASTLRQKGWNETFSAVESRWLPRLGMGTDRTHATIEPLDEPEIRPPDQLPGHR